MSNGRHTLDSRHFYIRGLKLAGDIRVIWTNQMAADLMTKSLLDCYFVAYQCTRSANYMCVSTVPFYFVYTFDE